MDALYQEPTDAALAAIHLQLWEVIVIVALAVMVGGCLLEKLDAVIKELKEGRHDGK